MFIVGFLVVPGYWFPKGVPADCSYAGARSAPYCWYVGMPPPEVISSSSGLVALCAFLPFIGELGFIGPPI
jgi:hypothetical protein